MDGKLAITGDESGRVSLWSMQDGELINTIMEPKSYWPCRCVSRRSVQFVLVQRDRLHKQHYKCVWQWAERVTRWLQWAPFACQVLVHGWPQIARKSSDVPMVNLCKIWLGWVNSWDRSRLLAVCYLCRPTPTYPGAGEKSKQVILFT